MYGRRLAAIDQSVVDSRTKQFREPDANSNPTAILFNIFCERLSIIQIICCEFFYRHRHECLETCVEIYVELVYS